MSETDNDVSEAPEPTAEPAEKPKVYSSAAKPSNEKNGCPRGVYQCFLSSFRDITMVFLLSLLKYFFTTRLISSLVSSFNIVLHFSQIILPEILFTTISLETFKKIIDPIS